MKKKYLRLRLVLGTELSAKNKSQAIGSLAVPVLRYSFGVVNWRQEELDRKMKLLTIHGQHHPKGRHRSLVCFQKTGRGREGEREREREHGHMHVHIGHS